jgi:phosphoserine phosphatase
MRRQHLSQASAPRVSGPPLFLGLALCFLTAIAASAVRAEGALPSWSDADARRAIIAFVDRVTTSGSPDYVAPPERIAVFDNDGTLWSEQPLYVQLAFALDRVKALAPRHPEWKETQPYKAALEGDTTDEFAAIVKDWLAEARHPKTGRRYTEMVYQPMLELLAYLRANGFKTFIVSGGGIEFMRPWAEQVYGVPPERVVGSSIETKYEVRDGRPVLVRLPQIDFIDDKAGKPVGIHQRIGRRPIAAFGNSDGDFQMLEWTTAGAGARLGLIVHHDDAEREYAYDRQSAIGRLDRGLDEAPRRGWIVVSMKNDWKRVFAE